jgi:hypothetical protein
MFSAIRGKSLTSQEKQVGQPKLSKVYFDIAQGNKTQDFSKVREWTKGVMDMYEKDLKYLNLYGLIETGPFDQVWKYWTERKPIFIDPDFQASLLDASYSRVIDETYGGLLQFNSYPSDNGDIIYTSQNEDVVTHEAGHAFLDIIRPDFYSQQRFQTLAIHESFGDLTCLFYHLSDQKNRIQGLEETKGDLSLPSFLSLIAEPLSKGTKHGELRNLLNDKKMGQTECEQHDLSNVFSAVIYELLKELYNTLRVRSSQDLEKLLDEVQSALRRLLLQSLIEISYSNPSFSDIGKHMKERAKGYKILVETNFAEKIQEIFSRKGINITKSHTDDDDICKINLQQQPDQGLRSFCSTFNNGFSYN